jgi:3-methyladenine DNA glycosylase AlkC
LAEPLKNHFGPALIRRVAESLKRAYPALDADAFEAEARRGLDDLELLDRARHVARALHAHLPRDFERASAILVASLGPPLDRTEGLGMSVFMYLPHVLYVAEHGLGHFEASMRAQHALTQRFTAEFSLRSFYERYPQATLARLAAWCADPSVHVRRLVSEGTRPRLPWAPRLRALQDDPSPMLPLLERLRDDPEEYVRRSVANHLNDIGKDHPDLLVEVARRWMDSAPPARVRLLRHALRSLVKKGDAGALGVLGFGAAPSVRATGRVTPRRVAEGGRVTVAIDLENTTRRTQRVAVDLAIHFVKASGEARPKVFKGRELTLAPGERGSVEKTISLAPMTTRRHYAGHHRVDAIVNGRAEPIGGFDLAKKRLDRGE